LPYRSAPRTVWSRTVLEFGTFFIFGIPMELWDLMIDIKSGGRRIGVYSKRTPNERNRIMRHFDYAMNFEDCRGRPGAINPHATEFF
jgi:hypothetical protein